MSGQRETQDQERARNLANPPKPRELDPEYVKAYNRGWNTSNRPCSERGGWTSLDLADKRGEPDAWYHGYSDLATGEGKWRSVPDSARLNNAQVTT